MAVLVKVAINSMNFTLKSNDVLHIARKINSKVLMDVEMISIGKEILNTYNNVRSIIVLDLKL